MSQVAIRVNEEAGLEERLEYIRTTRGALYSWSGRPSGSTACVVICSSIAGDFTANYHRERLLGFQAASQGLGVVRFHYSGDGNSQGDRRDMTFSTMCLDARAAVDHAVSIGFQRVALVGTRIGGFVAATVASQLPIAPLALWEPVVDISRFLAEMRRAKRMSAVVQQPSAKADASPEGVIDAFGYAMYPPLLLSLQNLDLLAIVGLVPRPVFLGRFGRQTAVDAVLEKALSDRAFPVQKASFGLTESWWFEDEFVHDTGNLITETVGWLVRSFEVGA